MSGRRIREDHKRYHDIIRDKVKHKLRDHIKNGRKIERRGKDYVVVDIPVIDLPRFKHGDPYEEGIGAGGGELGDKVKDGPDQPGDGNGQAGSDKGEHTVGVGVPLDMYVDILGEELSLPKLKPKSTSEIIRPKIKYDKIAKVGNNSLIHKKRTLKNVIRRSIASDEYNPDDISNLYPVPEDKEYRSWSEKDTPDVNAVIFFMQDISASMDASKRELVRELCWYLECWIRKFYDQTDIKYMVHDVEASEVDSEKFYNYTSGGGTKISSVFELATDTIDSSYPVEEWNIYCFYLSDGENWGSDNSLCINYLKKLQDVCNVIGITEVKAQRDWAEFVLRVDEAIDDGVLDRKTVTTGTVNAHRDILSVLKEFLTIGAR
jgi:uncharacterized protein